MSERQLGQFNLIDEAWIHAESLDGTDRRVGLRELFSSAHELRALRGELPTQDFAILRVLLAILYRALDELPSADPIARWEELWCMEQLPAEPIEAYLQEWHHRFNLIDDAAPFMQTSELRTSKGEWKPIALIVPDSDPDGALFTMRSRMDSISLDEAARWLVHANAYDYSGIKSGAVGDARVKGGKGYPMGLGWCGWLGGTWIEGQTLRETLLLNLVLDRSPRMSQDLPIWEKAPLGAAEMPAEKLGPFGQLDLLTWPQRRIRLRFSNGRADAVVVANGDAIDYTVQNNRELMTPWRYSEPQTKNAKAIRFMPKSLEPGRSLWRGLSTLLPNEVPEQAESPYGQVSQSLPAGVVVWVSQLVDSGVLSKRHRVAIHVTSMVYGTQSASFKDVLHDELRFSAILTAADEKGTRAIATEAARRAERVAGAIWKLAAGLARAAGARDIGSSPERFEGAFYAQLDREFPDWLKQLTSENADAQLLRWSENLHQMARTTAREIEVSIPAKAWAGRDIPKSKGEGGVYVNAGAVINAFEWNLRRALGDETRADRRYNQEESHD